MRVIQSASAIQSGGRPVCLAIGVFDGVHLGHQTVLRGAMGAARAAGGLAVAVTFDRHPNSVVAPDRTPPLIQTVDQKLAAIRDLGLDATLLLRFDLDLSRVGGEEFVLGIAREAGRLAAVSVGEGFTFGHKRSGDVALLRRLGRDLNFEVQETVPLAESGQVISSTRIRELIREGDLPGASRMMGRPYAIEGRVVKGDGIGRKLGTATANIDVSGLVLPPDGVYAVRAGSSQAVMNIGVRPSITAVAPARRVEVHLLDFDGDLYGQRLEATLVRRLRDETRFESLDALKTQIGQDIARARAILAD